jgi:hypothetical protein
MHPPPPNSVIEQLKQGYILCIAYGKYIVHINFDNGHRLSFEAPFKFGPADDLPNLPVNSFPLHESNLIRVLVCTVVDVACEEDGTLRLRFSSGDVLVIYADPMNKSYSLLIDAQEYFV